MGAEKKSEIKYAQVKNTSDVRNIISFDNYFFCFRQVFGKRQDNKYFNCSKEETSNIFFICRNSKISLLMEILQQLNFEV